MTHCLGKPHFSHRLRIRYSVPWMLANLPTNSIADISETNKRVVERTLPYGGDTTTWICNTVFILPICDVPMQFLTDIWVYGNTSDIIKHIFICDGSGTSLSTYDFWRYAKRRKATGSGTIHHIKMPTPIPNMNDRSLRFKVIYHMDRDAIAATSMTMSFRGVVVNPCMRFNDHSFWSNARWIPFHDRRSTPEGELITNSSEVFQGLYFKRNLVGVPDVYGIVFNSVDRGCAIKTRRFNNGLVLDSVVRKQ